MSYVVRGAKELWQEAMAPKRDAFALGDDELNRLAMNAVREMADEESGVEPLYVRDASLSWAQLLIASCFLEVPERCSAEGRAGPEVVARAYVLLGAIDRLMCGRDEPFFMPGPACIETFMVLAIEANRRLIALEDAAIARLESGDALMMRPFPDELW